MARSSRVKKVKSVRQAKKKSSPKKPAIKQKKMCAKDIKFYKGLLIKERVSAGGDLSHIAENTLNKSAREMSGDLSGYSYHMADMASDDYERDFSLGRATEEQKRLFAIDEAMKRMEEGIFGSCLQCGCAISRKRLSAIPYVELCIECQKKKEE